MSIELSCILTTMQPNILTLPIAIVFSVFLLGASYGTSEKREKVVVSVTRVMHQKNSIGDKVTLSVTIHAPARLGGFQFLIETDSKDRVVTRKKYPTGSLQILELPVKTMKELEDQIEARISVEKTLDRGIDPRSISQAFVMPSVRMSELPKSMVECVVATQSDEQDEEP